MSPYFAHSKSINAYNVLPRLSGTLHFWLPGHVFMLVHILIFWPLNYSSLLCSSNPERWFHSKNTVLGSLVFLLSTFSCKALIHFHTLSLHDRAANETFPVPGNWRPRPNGEGKEALAFLYFIDRAANSEDVRRVKGYWAPSSREPSSL